MPNAKTTESQYTQYTYSNVCDAWMRLQMTRNGWVSECEWASVWRSFITFIRSLPISSVRICSWIHCLIIWTCIWLQLSHSMNWIEVYFTSSPSVTICSSCLWLFSIFFYFCFSFSKLIGRRGFLFFRSMLNNVGTKLKTRSAKWYIIKSDLQLGNAREHTHTNWHTTKCTIFHSFRSLPAFCRVTIVRNKLYTHAARGKHPFGFLFANSRWNSK